MAATLGIVTPFCSCSAVPLFVGFVSAGVPLGVTFSFLIASPMINEVALGLLFALLPGLALALGWLARSRAHVPRPVARAAIPESHDTPASTCAPSSPCTHAM